MYKGSKFDIIWEHISYWTLCFVILTVCGGFLPAFLCVIGGGNFFVDTLHAPLLSLGYVPTKIAYGAMTFLVITAVTKAWFIQGLVNQWQEWTVQHRRDIDTLKYGPPYLRRASA